jgi:hypothetical protein
MNVPTKASGRIPILPLCFSSAGAVPVTPRKPSCGYRVNAPQGKAVGHVGLWNRDGGQVGSGKQGEIGYDGLPRIMLVHDFGQPCVVPGSGEERLSVSAA